MSDKQHANPHDPDDTQKLVPKADTGIEADHGAQHALSQASGEQTTSTNVNAGLSGPAGQVAPNSQSRHEDAHNPQPDSQSRHTDGHTPLPDSQSRHED